MIKHDNFPLSSLLYYGIGGTARYLIEASSLEDAQAASEYLTANRIDRTMVVGLGSNLLFPDGLFDGAVLRLAPGSRPQIRDMGNGLVEAFAGEKLDDVITFGLERGYIGLEWAGGLPGTVGAAVRGNVGAFGGELKDVLVSAELLARSDFGCETRRSSNAELRFAYRDSVVKQDRRLVVTSAVFGLHPADESDLEAATQRYRSNIDYRNRNHPMEYPTCGSVFKNIAGREEVERIMAVWPDVKENVEGRWHGKVSMGYVINRFGLSGYQIGGAQISTKHNNFIVNLGNARFSDVYGLIQKVKDEFSSTFGFVPEPEVEIVGLTP
jgi:UDP-N-acetylmuramate dehydrogenase